MRTQVQHWIALGERFRIQVVAPFCIELRSGRALFTALLPHFGGSSGTVVDPDWSAIKPFVANLQDAGYGFSCVTLNQTYDDISAREMLIDWGWNGIGQRPDWL